MKQSRTDTGIMFLLIKTVNNIFPSTLARIRNIKTLKDLDEMFKWFLEESCKQGSCNPLAS